MDYKHILVTGQSLANGGQGTPALSTYQPYSNLMMTPLPAADWFMDLYEQTAEKPSSALGNTLTALDDTNAIVTVNANDGSAYVDIKNGTQTYTNGITQVTNALSVAASRYAVGGVSVMHGEQDDTVGTTRAQYAADLSEWQSDYESDINAVTGLSQTIPMLVCQLSSHALHDGTPISGITLAQYDAAKDNASIFLAGPKYQFPYEDSSHLTNLGYRMLGEMHARAWRVILSSGDWVPLMPLSVSRTGAIITVEMSVPVLPLAFDTTLVAEVPNYGFEYADDGDGNSVSISSVAIDGSSIVITLDDTPTGSNQVVRYAYTNQNEGDVGASGNLRDSDTSESLYDNPMYNWCVHFEEPIA